MGIVLKYDAEGGYTYSPKEASFMHLVPLGFEKQVGFVGGQKLIKDALAIGIVVEPGFNSGTVRRKSYRYNNLSDQYGVPVVVTGARAHRFHVFTEQGPGVMINPRTWGN